MSQFLYHIPKLRGAARAADLAANGLADRLPAEPLSQNPNAPGPDGAVGLLLQYGGGVPRYKPDDQEWIEHAGVWVGMAKAQPPGPADLARDVQLDGERVQLGDGQEWLVPVVLKFPGTVTLPRKLSLVDGEWQTGDVIDRHKVLWDAAWRVFQAYVNAPQHDSRIIIEDPMDVAVGLLSANYRVSDAEASLLGLFTTDNLWRGIFEVAIDWQSFVDRQGELGPGAKKNGEPPADDESTETSGSPDS